MVVQRGRGRRGSTCSARCMLCRDSRITPVSLLKRVISWTSTVFMLSSYSTGYLRCTASKSKAGGSARRHSLTSPATRASEAPPPGPPPELPPLVDARDWNISAVSFWSRVMSAFWCSPNASGEAVMGRPSMYLQTCHWELGTMLQSDRSGALEQQISGQIAMLSRDSWAKQGTQQKAKWMLSRYYGTGKISRGRG